MIIFQKERKSKKNNKIDEVLCEIRDIKHQKNKRTLFWSGNQR